MNGCEVRMKQHNYWKLQKLYHASINCILWVLGGVILICSYFGSKVDYELISQIIGYVALVIGFLLKRLEKKLWKTKVVQKAIQCDLIDDYWTPVIEGRWEGTLTRNGIPDSGKKHAFVIEITQSFTAVSCVTFSEHSFSESLAAEILYDEVRKRYQLIHYWQCKTTNVQPGTGDTNAFNGFTMLDIIKSDNGEMKLSGTYFTDRQPHQTKGTVEVKFVQKELKNSFS